MKKKIIAAVIYVVAALGALVAILPPICVLFSSFMGKHEALEAFGAAFGQKDGFAQPHFIPMYPTLRHYIGLLFDTPEFFVMFRNSVAQTISIAVGQTLFALPAAWGFTQYKFKGRKILFMLYIILMIMPFQVTMVSSYVILDKLSMTDTLLSIILPNVFSTFPVFIISKAFEDLPKSLLEAAYLDGANEIQAFIHIGIPLGLPGVFAAMTLSFIEYWNNIEQPLTFIRDKAKWPVALYLPEITADNISISMVAALAIMLPSVFVFAAGQKYLEQGIIVSGLNE